MPLRTLLLNFLSFAVYPAWLIAGALDYACHRRTKIEHTSGRTEGWLHVAQFVTIAIIFFAAVLLKPTLAMIAIAGTAAMLHLVLSYVDVSYTQSKRFISPLEQHVHAFLNVLPIVAVCLLALIGSSDGLWSNGLVPQVHELSPRTLTLFIGSFVVLAGTPVIEEFLRTATKSPVARKDVHVASMLR